MKQAGTLPFMQMQGQSNYCGLCAFNNLVGQEVISVERMNNVADDLWLRQCEQLNLSLIENMQFHRDINGFHSHHTMEEVAECYGYSLQLLHSAIRALFSDQVTMPNPQVLLREILRNYQPPVKLLIHERDIQHYTVMHIYQNSSWYFDSLSTRTYTRSIACYIAKSSSDHIQFCTQTR